MLILLAGAVFVLIVCVALFGKKTPHQIVNPAPQPSRKRGGCGLLFIVLCMAGAAIVVAVFWPAIVSYGNRALSFVQSSSQSAQAPSSESVVGDPDLSATFIDTVLKNAGSPASGLGQEIYQDGFKAHIKPSFLLGVFHMESHYGLYGIAPVNHSVGNVRDPSGGYRSYSSWIASIQDFYAVVQTRYVGQGLTTVSTIIPVFAPASDGNNPDTYIQVVRTDMTRWDEQNTQ